MILATTIELAILWNMLASRDVRTVVVGVLLAGCYAYYSASWSLCARFIAWWHDRNEPPGGMA